MKKRLTVGLIGVGGFGAAHVKVLQQLEAESVVQLMCVADPSLERLADTRRMMQARNVRWHTDFRTLLEQEWELDAVAIAAPIHLHMEIACASIARDLFVYLEKPPVPLIQQLNELIERDAHRKVTVGFQLINSSAIKQLKVWRTEGKLGDIQCIRVHGCSPRTVEYYARAPWAGKLVYEGKPVFDGPATNALSHWLHNIMYLAGREMDSFDVPRELEAELYRTKPIESYDTICMRGHLKSGIEFQYAVTHASEKPELLVGLVNEKVRSTRLPRDEAAKLVCREMPEVWRLYCLNETAPYGRLLVGLVSEKARAVGLPTHEALGQVAREIPELWRMYCLEVGIK